MGGLEAFAVISRRRWLSLALGGGALEIGAAGGVFAVLGRAPEVPGLTHLSPREHRTLAALARTHLPRGGPYPEGADDFELARAFDGFLAGEPADNVRDLKRALLLLELSPLLFAGELTPFSRLAPGAQLRCWQGWMESERLIQRQVSLAFRKFLSLVFFDRPELWPRIGYPGPLVRS